MYRSKNDFFFRVTEKKNNNHIGNTRCGPIDWKNLKSGFGILIGDRDAHGKGYGVEFFEIIKHMCFNILKLNKIEFPAVVENIAATKLYTKIGLKRTEISEKWIKNGISYGQAIWSIEKNNTH